LNNCSDDSFCSGESCNIFLHYIVLNLDHRGDLGVDEKMILRWMFRKWDVGVWTGLSWLRIETVAGTCECGNKPSGSVKCREYLD
jgi:hypothetical protein